MLKKKGPTTRKESVPQPYAQGLFHLRMHIDMFLKKLMETREPKG